jgi:hypothetical protein
MIYNENIVKEYGSSNINMVGVAPAEYRPSPTKDDYNSGFIVRYFCKKINENRTYEIDPAKWSLIEKNLYVVVNLNWKISGTKENVMNGNIIEKTSVVESNDAEIERVKNNTGIDLSQKLSNRLEFWRGY